MCVYRVCVFCFDLGDILYKKKTHGKMSVERQSFHTELDVFYGNLVNFSLYFFLHISIYTLKDCHILLPLELIFLPAIDLIFKSNSSVLCSWQKILSSKRRMEFSWDSTPILRWYTFQILVQMEEIAGERTH